MPEDEVDIKQNINKVNQNIGQLNSVLATLEPGSEEWKRVARAIEDLSSYRDMLLAQLQEYDSDIPIIDLDEFEDDSLEDASDDMFSGVKYYEDDDASDIFAVITESLSSSDKEGREDRDRGDDAEEDDVPNGYNAMMDVFSGYLDDDPGAQLLRESLTDSSPIRPEEIVVESSSRSSDARSGAPVPKSTQQMLADLIDGMDVPNKTGDMTQDSVPSDNDNASAYAVPLSTSSDASSKNEELEAMKREAEELQRKIAAMQAQQDALLFESDISEPPIINDEDIDIFDSVLFQEADPMRASASNEHDDDSDNRTMRRMYRQTAAVQHGRIRDEIDGAFSFSERSNSQRRSENVPFFVGQFNIVSSGAVSSMYMECWDSTIKEWDIGGILMDQLMQIEGYTLPGVLEEDGAGVTVSWNGTRSVFVTGVHQSHGRGVLTETAIRRAKMVNAERHITDRGVITESCGLDSVFDTIGLIPEMDVTRATIVISVDDIEYRVHFEADSSDIEVDWVQKPNMTSDDLAGVVSYLSSELYRHMVFRESDTPKSERRNKVTRAGEFHFDHQLYNVVLSQAMVYGEITMNIASISIDKNGKIEKKALS